jgi:ABC-type phosphate transport system substrate-binding protein
MSSRPLTAAEAADLYVVQVAGDAFVIAVNNSANMSFLTNITVSQLHDIYAGIITNWNALGGPNQPIVPRARITASGSQPDFNGQVGVTSAQESATIAATGLPRLTESVDMANAVVGVDYQIAYTSLANLDVAGMKTLTVNGIVASPATVIDQTFPLKRRLYMMARGLTLSPVNGQRIDGLDVDYSPLVRADDFLDYVTSATGEAAIAAQGFVSVPSVLVIPDWDINMDGTTGVGDLGEILAKWGLQTNCKGWIRADGNNSGKVSVSDVGTVTGHWAQPGFVPPVYTP